MEEDFEGFQFRCLWKRFNTFLFIQEHYSFCFPGSSDAKLNSFNNILEVWCKKIDIGSKTPFK